MCLEFNDYKEYFQDYCGRFGLDFEKVSHLPKSIGPEDIVILDTDHDSANLGLLDETPMSPVLIMRKGRGRTGFTIEQTEYTDTYIAL